MLGIVPDSLSTALSYKDLWPQILARHVIRRVDVNKIAGDLKKQGLLVFPDWEMKKRVPQANYRVYRKA